MKDPRINLHDISRFSHEIMSFARGQDYEAFVADTLRVRAVSYCLLAIGEAVLRLERDFPGFLVREVSAEAPWQQVIGTRNFLAHGYDRIDPDTIWRVIERELVALMQAIDLALERLKDKE